MLIIEDPIVTVTYRTAIHPYTFIQFFYRLHFALYFL